MRNGKKTPASRTTMTKAQEVLRFAEEKAKEAKDWVELHNAIYSADGKATRLFPTAAEKKAFTKTKESRQIHALMNTLPSPPVKYIGNIPDVAKGAGNIRLPHSLHAALLAEAEAEGVTLNELCLSKLAAQLRAVVQAKAIAS